MKDFLVGPFGFIFTHLIRAFVGSVCVCAGVQLFDYRNPSPFFTWRKVLGLFFIVIGASRLISVLFT